jgi:hypothetical protein
LEKKKGNPTKKTDTGKKKKCPGQGWGAEAAAQPKAVQCPRL